MKKEETATNEFKPVAFDKAQFNQKPVLFDSDANQTIPFFDTRYTKSGVVNFRAAHTFAPLTDERLFQHEKNIELFSRKNKNIGAIENTQPTIDLWDDLIVARQGYTPREDWKAKVKSVDKIAVVTSLLHVQLIETEDVLDEDTLINEDDLTCLKFRVFYGGISLEEWRKWYQTGLFPENIKLSETQFDEGLTLLRKDIAPSVVLTTSFYFAEASDTQLDEANAILFGGNAPNKLASAAHEKKTNAEKWVELYNAVCESAEGYTGRVPAYHAAAATRVFFYQESARVGKQSVAFDRE